MIRHGRKRAAGEGRKAANKQAALQVYGIVLMWPCMNRLSPRCASLTDRWRWLGWLAYLITAVLLSACRIPIEIEPVTVTPAPAPLVTDEPATVIVEPTLFYTGPKDLVVCLPREPETLYRYGRLTRVERAVLHGLYENDYTHLSFAHQPQGLAKLPNLADGDAQWQQVTVRAGDRVVDINGQIVQLGLGDRVRGADGETAVFAGAPLVMSQLVVDFTLLPRVWADGQPVSAADSVFGFTVAAHPDTPAVNNKIERTASYTALDESTTRWVGLPGFSDPTYFTNFWGPLPQHVWADFTPAQLLTMPESQRFPLGDGPFRVAEWVSGQYLRLEPNPFYYRAAEGLPRLESVVFRFLPDADRRMVQILTGQCDIVTQDAVDFSQTTLFLEAAVGGVMQPYFQIGTVYEAISLGVNSWDNYGDYRGRPDWFEDVRVRQALALCLNRQRMVGVLFNGRSSLTHAQIPTIHPLFPPEIQTWPYDVAAANALLDAAGYFDTDKDGWREDLGSGQPFQVRFTTTTQLALNEQLATLVREDLSLCGIDAQIELLPVNQWYANGEESPLFGRRFDMGHIAWPVGDQSYCHLFASWEITGPAGRLNPLTETPYAGWGGLNNTGWWLPDYDTACRKARDLLPGMPGYDENFQETQRLLAENLPLIPLFMRAKLALAKPQVRHFQLDPTQESELWNLFALDLGVAAEN
jgi:peptide/nickel transport system substrate-binding protein